MVPRVVFALPFFALWLVLAGPAAADTVRPRADSVFTGSIQFPRKQKMTIQTGGDSTRLKVAMGFDGRCRGGGLSELWATNVPVRESVRLKDATFSFDVSGRSERLGGIAGRTGDFTWKLIGRFITRDTAFATVTGNAVVRSRGKVISRCRISKPATVKLTS